jgi:hypothetical protein
MKKNQYNKDLQMISEDAYTEEERKEEVDEEFDEEEPEAEL